MSAGDDGAGDPPAPSDDPTPERADQSPAPTMLRCWAEAAGVTVLSGVALAYAFQPARAGTIEMLAWVGGAYVVLAALACFTMWRRGELRGQLTPQRGDVSIGAMLAVLFHISGRLVAMALRGSEREPWLMRLYLQIGDPRYTAKVQVGVAILVIAALEEVTWRGLVMRSLVRAHGERVGWLVASALYAAAHLPTLMLLGDDVAGLNPLLVVASLGCGLLWGYLALKIDRLAPSIFAHALFSWSVVTYPLWSP